LPEESIDEKALVEDLRAAFESCANWLGESDRSRGPGLEYRSAPFAVPCGAATLVTGSRLDDFEVLDELGRGGMGVVYRARQTSLDRDVALKVLPATAGRGPSAVHRFRTEAQAVARLNHPNVVPIYAQGEHDGHLYYAMELIDGTSLDVVIRSRPELLTSSFWRSLAGKSAVVKPGELMQPAGYCPEARGSGNQQSDGPAATARTLEDFRRVSALVAGVADGLAHAYTNGVIHRDIKPHNLLLGSDGRLHITDFGLAHLIDEPHLTMTGEVMGTAAYLSPEQVRGDIGRIDFRTDIYSLGATLYELLTRHRPFEGETRDQILTGFCTSEPRRPRHWDKRIPRDLETICLRAMDKDPARRYPTAAAMAEDLCRFAEGRPILSRRVGPVETGVKWVRRHRAVTLAAMATTAALAFAAGLILSAVGSRHEEAASLLRAAYERLAYLDYRRPELVAEDIERAEALGADPVQLGLVKALAKLGATDEPAAIEHLQPVLDAEPNDARALYMLAWAQWRSGDQTASVETFRNADDLGGPTSDDGWFFRGLAAHFDRPEMAMESYRQANALRALQNEFYPQAVLHLARAYSQQLYVTRDTASFPEAEANLRQLIEHKYYGAYPYYLLSIAHRLTAESYENDGDSTNDATVEYHWGEALNWARGGQLADAADERPVTAEAECLESMGRWEEAIAARTRAIALADTSREQWEGYHYRWRLYYWTDRFDAALADLEACRGYTEGSLFYDHAYRALVRAEVGDMELALSDARAMADDDPSNAYHALWSATTLRLLDRPEEAYELLSARAGQVDFARDLVHPQSAAWMGALYGFCLGETDFDALVSLADASHSPRKLRAEAHFHAAAKSLAEGDRAEALEHLTKAYRCYDGELGYTFHAKVILEKMREDTNRPHYIPPVDDLMGDD
jgi:serine/threonine protein kinase/tetratricopeptide (TPR) repeat protein